jgi:putative membrane protein
MNLLLRLLITAAVAYGLTHMDLLSGVRITDFKSAIVFALVLAFLNAIIRPIFIILTIPITIVTLGLFLLVINACMILLADKLMDSVAVDGFWWALLFSILLSLISSAIQSMFTKEKDKER